MAGDPRVIGEFEEITRIGESDVGAMYRGNHRQFGRVSYIRVLDRAYVSDAEAIRLALSLGYTDFNHPNTGGGCMYTTSISRGRIGGSVFFVCSPANALDLETVARERGPLPWSEVRWIMLDVCCGLNEAHRLGFAHGDLQAGHCFLIEYDDGLEVHRRVRVTGFGLADARYRAVINGAPPPAWMPPEQVAGAEPDARADVYAAAWMMLHLLLGEAPVSRDRQAWPIYRREAPSLEYRKEPPAWPGEVDAILERALAPDPGARFSTIRELAEAIAGDDVVTMRRFDRKGNSSESLHSAPESALAVSAPTELWQVAALLAVAMLLLFLALFAG